MFAKLRMTVEEASQEFCTIAEEVYRQIDITPKQRTDFLRRCLEDLMKKKHMLIDTRLMGEKQIGGCEW